MQLQRLVLNNFRNYTYQELTPDPNLNLLIGNNAQGKTNLIESIYYSSIGKSYRTNKDDDIIKWQKGYFQLELEILGLRNFKINIFKENNQKKKLKSMG